MSWSEFLNFSGIVNYVTKSLPMSLSLSLVQETISVTIFKRLLVGQTIAPNPSDQLSEGSHQRISSAVALFKLWPDVILRTGCNWDSPKYVHSWSKNNFNSPQQGLLLKTSWLLHHSSRTLPLTVFCLECFFSSVGSGLPSQWNASIFALRNSSWASIFPFWILNNGGRWWSKCWERIWRMFLGIRSGPIVCQRRSMRCYHRWKWVINRRLF